ncbi:MAG: hypothetical protein RLZZ383_1521 [Pseudomonadota bacterium]
MPNGHAAAIACAFRLYEAERSAAVGRASDARAAYREVLRDGTGTADADVAMAWRGLARLAVRDGDLAAAVSHFEQEVDAWRALAARDAAWTGAAAEAEATAICRLAEIQLRRGFLEAAGPMFERAFGLLAALDGRLSPEAWLLLAQLARHRGDAELAARALDRAESGFRDAGDDAGYAETLLARAIEEGTTAEGRARRSERAEALARRSGRADLASRALLLVDDDDPRPVARLDLQFSEGAELAMRVGDRALAALHQTRRARLRAGAGIPIALGAAQVLLEVEHYPAIGDALLALVQCAVGAGEDEVALAGAEAAWRVYRTHDPDGAMDELLGAVAAVFHRRRMGRALWVVTAARHARTPDDPAIAAYHAAHAARVPGSWHRRVEGMSAGDLTRDARRLVQRAILPVLKRYGLGPASFASAQSALDAVGVIAGVSPRAWSRRLFSAEPLDVDVVGAGTPSQGFVRAVLAGETLRAPLDLAPLRPAVGAATGDPHDALSGLGASASATLEAWAGATSTFQISSEDLRAARRLQASEDAPVNTEDMEPFVTEEADLFHERWPSADRRG